MTLFILKVELSVLFLVVSGAVSAQNPVDSILEVRDTLIRKANESVLNEPEMEELVNMIATPNIIVTHLRTSKYLPLIKGIVVHPL